MDFNKDFLLLQINDALFPIGGYSHSFGLETYIQKNIVTNGEKAKEYILSRINNSIKYTELLGIRVAYNEAEKENIEIKTYRIIYDAIEDVKSAMIGMLEPEYKEVVNGKAEVRMTYKISNVGTIAGCYVTDGKIVRNSEIRVIRDGIVIFESTLASLKRFKDDAKEVAKGYECGLSVEKFNDLKEGDVIESFTMEAIKRKEL